MNVCPELPQDDLADALNDPLAFGAFARVDAQLARVRAMASEEIVTFRRIEAQHQATMAALARQDRAAVRACQTLAGLFQQDYNVNLSQYRYEPGEARYIFVESADGRGESAVSGPDDGVQP